MHRSEQTIALQVHYVVLRLHTHTHIEPFGQYMALPVGTMASVKVRVINADFGHTVQLRREDRVGLSCGVPVLSLAWFVDDNELDGSEVAGELAILSAIFVEAETTADKAALAIAQSFQCDLVNFTAPMSGTDFLTPGLYSNDIFESCRF